MIELLVNEDDSLVRRLRKVLLGVYVSEIEQGSLSLTVGMLLLIRNAFPIDATEQITGRMLLCCGALTLIGNYLALRSSWSRWLHYIVRGTGSIAWMWIAVRLAWLWESGGGLFPSMILFGWMSTLAARSIAIDVEARRAVKRERDQCIARSS